jgi:hypothetical protein
MTPAERSLRAALAATSAFALGYLLPGPLALPVLLYDPVNRTAFLGVHPDGMVMRYYGDLLVASVAAALACGVAWRFPRRTPLPIVTAVTLSLIALDLAFYLSRLAAAV